MHEIYLDNSATTKVLPEAAALAYKIMTEVYGNPSSLHKKGLAAHRELKQARAIIAQSIAASPEEIIFTASGTAADNLALLGIAESYQKRGRHIITTEIEHPAVLNTCKHLKERGFEISYLPVDASCRVDPASLTAALREDTILVSVMLVNNEIGSLQPVQEIAQILKAQAHKIFFHVDAVQAYGKIKISPKAWGIDLLAASGHKIGAPKGVGFLYVADKIRLQPLLHGGGQERNLSSGTENLPAIAAFGLAAAYAAENLTAHYEKVSSLRKELLAGLTELPAWQIHEAAENLPHVLNLAFAGIKSEVLLHSLSAAGLSVSSGSACAAGKDKLSHVLAAMRLGAPEIESSLRFSFSPENTLAEAKEAAKIVCREVRLLREVLQK